MAYDFPLPDIERAQTIIDAFGAMVVGRCLPCLPGSGLHHASSEAHHHSPARRLPDVRRLRRGRRQAQGEAIAALLEGDKALFELLDERPGHWAIAGSGPGRYTDSCGREWHWKLRQARNTCERVFERLEQDAWRHPRHPTEGSR